MSRPIGCRSTGVFKAGKFEKDILLRVSPNEMYFYDINIKLFRIVSEKRLKQKPRFTRAQSKEFWNSECSVCDIL